jgi:SAM-dependent methyltransferase
MIPRRRAIAPLLLCLAAAASAQEKSVKPGINDPFKDPDLPKFLKTFEGESREIFVLRQKIVEACKLKQGMVIADVGAGTGLFTRMFAKEVGPKGKVYAVDIAQKFLDHVKKTCAVAKLTNVQTIRCTQTSAELPAGSCDLVFVCDTYHHFEFPFRTLASIHKALKPNGTLIVVDFHRIKGKSSAWIMGHVRAGQEVVSKEITTSGFKLAGEEKGLGLKENYFLRFVKVQEKPKAPPAKGASIHFNRDVRPILSDACFACHGPDRAKRKGGLRLDTEAGLSVVVPGQPGDSELMARITATDPSKRMPPPRSGRALSSQQIANLRQWIEQGAKWEPHWAYIAPKRPAVPAVKNPGWLRNPIDAFVLARLEREGLAPALEAPRATWLRRVALDLTGLPPSPEDVDSFVADRSPDAHERAIDRLLAAPRFGERLALDWLDAARYADSNGYQTDGTRTMWPWRDWAIAAFNANLPFDQFTTVQLAGDLLPAPTTQQRIATGFHRNHMLNGEGGRIAEESRIDYVVDRVDTTATVWLGLTLGCARCHDHKFDPFTARDYYSLFAYFNSVAESGAVDRGGNANPVLDLPTPEQAQRRLEIQAAIRDLEAKRKTAPLAVRGSIDKEIKSTRGRLNTLNRSIFSVMVMQDLPQPRATHVLVRGAWDQKGVKVTPGVPKSLPGLPKDAPPNRLGLARWLMAPANPLTARVIVNRYWQMLFGAGLVRTPEDFGVQGEPPTHPELLDWLAVQFRESGWDVKKLLRLIVTSATYRQSSRMRNRERGMRNEEEKHSSIPHSAFPIPHLKDPDNRLLARGPRHRLPSPVIRDQALAVSGLLVERQGGPPVRPYQPPGIWEEMTFGFIRYQQDRGPSLHRRSLYTFWRRTIGPTNLFDTSARQVCVVRPFRTNTPVHALVTLNDVTYVEAARALAERLLREGGATSESRIARGFKLATARAPSQRETAVLVAAQKRLLAHYRADRQAALELLSAGESPRDPKLDVAELASYAGVCSVILNLDEVISRE